MWLVCLLANQHETFTWKHAFSVFSVLQGSAEALIRWGGKIWHLLIACFLNNISAKYYENQTMLSRVIAKNIGDVFFETQCNTKNNVYGAVVMTESLQGSTWTVHLISLERRKQAAADSQTKWTDLRCEPTFRLLSATSTFTFNTAQSKSWYWMFYICALQSIQLCYRHIRGNQTLEIKYVSYDYDQHSAVHCFQPYSAVKCSIVGMSVHLSVILMSHA